MKTYILLASLYFINYLAIGAVPIDKEEEKGLHLSASSNYEICKENQKEWTQKVTFSANQFHNRLLVCPNCLLSNRQLTSTGEGVVIPSKDQNIPQVCFHASALLHNGLSDRGYYHCKTKDSIWPDCKEQKKPCPVRPCINKDYTEMTTKAFNRMSDCFNFSASEREWIFALLHHESRFMLNAKSFRKARCYGQLTINAIKNINRNIYYKEKGAQFGKIYYKALHICPELKDTVTPQNITLSHSNVSDSLFDNIMRSAPITCKTTHDPYSCLFYSFFNIRINMEYYDTNHKKKSKYRGKRNFSTQMEKDFKLPIRLNEMLVLSGPVVIKSTGKTRKPTWLFWDDSELYDTLKQVEYKIEDLKIKKVKVFSEATLKNAFIHYAHNGGQSIVRTHLAVFIEQIKKRISNHELCSQNKLCPEWRASLIKSIPLNIETLRLLFNPYITENNLINKDELLRFTTKIEEDLHLIHNAGDHLKKRLQKINTEPIGDELAIDHLIHQAQTFCPAEVYF